MRAKPSFKARQAERLPLIEKRMNRQDCLAWLRRHDYQIHPKSASIACPFHDNRRWRQMREGDPLSWADAVELDRALRHGLWGIHGEVLPHTAHASRSMKAISPLLPTMASSTYGRPSAR